MDLDSIKETNPPATDKKAEQELKVFFSEQNREENVKKAVNVVFVIFIILISTVGIVVIGSRLLHLILPLHNQWLSIEQLQSIDKLFFSGAIGGFIGNQFRKVTEKRNSSN
jgi:thiamine pyrophosphokinase